MNDVPHGPERPDRLDGGQPPADPVEFVSRRETMLPVASRQIIGVVAAIPLLLLVGWGVAVMLPDRQASNSVAEPQQTFLATPEAPISWVVPEAPVTTSSTASTGDQLTTIDGILRQSHGSRLQVQGAVQDAGKCGQRNGLESDEQALTQAAQNRTELATRVEALGVPIVSDGTSLMAELTALLRHSAQADQEFAAWVADLRVSCSTDTSGANPHYQAGISVSKQASAAKRQFLELWNPLASQYGLQTWQETDL